MKVFNNIFEKTISLENLFLSWDEFKKGKQKKADVQEFERNSEQNMFQLRNDLISKTYKHGPYRGFYICDPKRRHIHKSEVRDRILHHAIFRILNPIFEPTFISNSFSCRIGKGTHKGVVAVRDMLRKESRNYTQTCFALKCDIRKFFDSVGHEILLSILQKRITDKDAQWLLKEIICSYYIIRERERERVNQSSPKPAFQSEI